MEVKEFEAINKGYKNIFQPNRLTIGLVVPIESYPNSPIPTMQKQLQRIQLAENLGFKAIWLRDIPFNVPSFGDVGQMFDPFTYLGYLASATKNISLAVGSIILPLRHPLHVAKSAASIDVLSNGRLILGVASGDRAQEYPALNIPYTERGDKFRESFEYIKEVWKEYPMFDNEFGSPYGGIDMLPKPTAKKVPMLITGASQQAPTWVNSNGNGWITYPREPKLQQKLINNWRENAKNSGAKYDKPVSQSLYLDLVDDTTTKPQPIHLGYKTSTDYLLKHLKDLEKAGVNHVALNLRFNNKNIEDTLRLLAQKILPEFS